MLTLIMEETKGSDLHCHDTRNKHLIRLTLRRTNCGQQTSHYMFFNEWNNFSPFVKDSSSFLAFKNNYVSVYYDHFINFLNFHGISN